jgi:hypothetical protein
MVDQIEVVVKACETAKKLVAKIAFAWWEGQASGEGLIQARVWLATAVKDVKVTEGMRSHLQARRVSSSRS